MWLDDFPEKRPHTIAVQAEIFEQMESSAMRHKNPDFSKKSGFWGSD
ncbi:hypothetical protein GXM_06858 [Nostoc sphaeroides CCNUC1]|uniref:Uncharacterized protein n=1 Tax=Nostoc sphaeroides CCNUC1 TaxID=2653204 RepID=A0A5P8W9N3_9NOSO|nr:hypothetical protein GXM_06858 [Nostoc sphaeroides CCNUC1]